MSLLEGGLVSAIEDGEFDPVEAREAFLGAHPQVPVRRPRNCLSRALRQTFGNLPVVENVLGRQERGIERKRAPGRRAHQKREQAANRDPNHERNARFVSHPAAAVRSGLLGPLSAALQRPEAGIYCAVQR